MWGNFFLFLSDFSCARAGNPERFTLLNRVPFRKFNKVNSEPVNAYDIVKAAIFMEFGSYQGFP